MARSIYRTPCGVGCRILQCAKKRLKGRLLSEDSGRDGEGPLQSPHRKWYLLPPARTSTIRLGSAVTVLSSDDPIRVFQRFSTLDAISNGRAEVILGRGSFIESFPLFGYDLSKYEELFEQKLDLFADLVSKDVVNYPVTGVRRSKISASIRRSRKDALRTGSVWVAVRNLSYVPRGMI